MSYVFACILSASILYIIFKGFEIYKVDLLQAIVVNYIVAGSLGFMLARINNNTTGIEYISKSPWFIYAIIIGFMFITIFNLMGLSSQKSGVSVTSVANKMSVAIPVIFGFVVFHEPATAVKVSGILLALVALIFVTRTGKNNLTAVIYPVILFFSSGILDTILGYSKQQFVTKENEYVFTASLFSIAAVFGLVFLSFLVLTGKQTLKGKNILGGIILGIPNFASILFVFKGMEATGFGVSTFFPLLNMGTVVMASLFAFVFFKEKLSMLNLVGIGLALVAIYFISMA